MADKLTALQENFCQEYMLDFNATQSAKRAGYDAINLNTFHAIGSENLRKPTIQARILELRADAANKLNMAKESILHRLNLLANFDIRKLYNEDGSMKLPHEWDDDTAFAVGSIEIYEEFTNMGKGVGMLKTGETKKVKPASDKKSAMDSIAKILGYNAPEKTEAVVKHVELTAEEALQYKQILDKSI